MKTVTGFLAGKWLWLAAAALVGGLWVWHVRTVAAAADAARTEARTDTEQRLHGHYAQVLNRISAKTARSAMLARRTEQAIATELAQQDERLTKERNDAKRELAAVRRDLASGARVVRVAGAVARCPIGASGADVPADAGASGVGDGAVTLDGAAAQRVADLYEQVGEDGAKLTYLQAYAAACQALTASTTTPEGQ